MSGTNRQRLFQFPCRPIVCFGTFDSHCFVFFSFMSFTFSLILPSILFPNPVPVNHRVLSFVCEDFPSIIHSFSCCTLPRYKLLFILLRNLGFALISSSRACEICTQPFAVMCAFVNVAPLTTLFVCGDHLAAFPAVSRPLFYFLFGFSLFLQVILLRLIQICLPHFPLLLFASSCFPLLGLMLANSDTHVSTSSSSLV